MHLGAKPDAGNAYSQNREQELWDSFRDIITICNQKKTDLLLIAGDLFHRQPLLRELKEMNSILEMLDQTEVVMIAGNHDHIRKNSYYRTFTWAPHVHMICSQEMSCVELDRIQTAVYGCSYHSREILEPLYDHAVPEGRQKYEILLDCQKVKFAMSDPPACQETKNVASDLSAANSDFWDSDWHDMTNGFKKWWDKLYHS